MVAGQSRYAQYVGRTAPPRTYEVERGHVARFVEALGDDNPTWSGERAPAPPTFAICLRPNDPREGLDIDWTKLLHGEQEFIHHRPMFVGDRITVVQRVAECVTKLGRSGNLDLMTLVTEGTGADGAPVFTARSLVVIRR